VALEVDQITETSVRLFFTEKHAVTIGGVEAVQEILGLIAKSAITTDGNPVSEVMATGLRSAQPQSSFATLFASPISNGQNRAT
jgi:hypothetical protein